VTADDKHDIHLEGVSKRFPDIEEAAMDLGATEWTTFRKVTLPLIAPGVAAAAMLAAALSVDDLAQRALARRDAVRTAE
jgi:ABC-type spermidine/putrescine transport system permease subunit II